MDHTPVLLHEVIKYLNLKQGSFVIDGTIDGGGHATVILERIGKKGTLLGVDWDESMIRKTKNRFANSTNVILETGNYADTPEILKKRNLGKADGLLLDLGFSSIQLEASGRGFSFEKNEPLLMTYSDTRVPVYQLLRELKEDELANVIFKYGEERFSRRIAHSIKEKGRRVPIMRTTDLRQAIVSAVPKSYEKGRIDPATRTFQALRIYANDELGNLEKTLNQLPEILKKYGRAVIISFHSLEDRIVKQEFRRLEKEGILKILIKKPIEASLDEKKVNPRSRSAKLRAIEII